MLHIFLLTNDISRLWGGGVEKEWERRENVNCNQLSKEKNIPPEKKEMLKKNPINHIVFSRSLPPPFFTFFRLVKGFSVRANPQKDPSRRTPH